MGCLASLDRPSMLDRFKLEALERIHPNQDSHQSTTWGCETVIARTTRSFFVTRALMRVHVDR